MRRARRLWSWLTWLSLAAGPGCEREPRAKRSSASPSASLDGMQLFSARRVTLESAVDAMQRRDLQRLKQLDVWVRNRAQVVLFEPDDLRSLELAIQCLEQVGPPHEAIAALDRVKTGELKEPARGACHSRLEPQPP